MGQNWTRYWRRLALERGRMTNHPNRNWRSRMQAGCLKFLDLWRWPAQGQAGVLTHADLREVMVKSYCAGYADGRQSTRTPRDDKTAV